MLEFPENYFRGEEREGFYVEEMMKRAWAAQLKVLEEIECICKKYNLTYFADFRHASWSGAPSGIYSVG